MHGERGHEEQGEAGRQANGQVGKHRSRQVAIVILEVNKMKLREERTNEGKGDE